jgi:hypothetical protein
MKIAAAIAIVIIVATIASMSPALPAMATIVAAKYRRQTRQQVQTTLDSRDCCGSQPAASPHGTANLTIQVWSDDISTDGATATIRHVDKLAEFRADGTWEEVTDLTVEQKRVIAERLHVMLNNWVVGQGLEMPRESAALPLGPVDPSDPWTLQTRDDGSFDVSLLNPKPGRFVFHINPSGRYTVTMEENPLR